MLFLYMNITLLNPVSHVPINVIRAIYDSVVMSLNKNVKSAMWFVIPWFFPPIPSRRF